MGLSFKDYRTIHGTTIPGRARKKDADMIMKETWWEDIQSQNAYMYDMFHDIGEEHFGLYDLHPHDDINKVSIPIKFIRHSSQTYAKDPVTYWLQLQPGQECNVDYFNDMYTQKYGNIWPVGLYIDICDEAGKYNKWLIVNTANFHQNQFPTYELLKCDHVFQWIHDGKKYECPGVLQSQNSYNSGLWLDYKIQSVQDQQKFAVPLNSITETLFYNHRMIIDSLLYNKDSEPRAWLISKINRLSPNGIARITLAQDTFDQHRDYIEKDIDGKTIGMWADYWTSVVEPADGISQLTDDQIAVTSKITCTGKQQIKIGGSAKTFTVSFYDVNNNLISDFGTGVWALYIGEDRVPNSIVDYLETDSQYKLKIKFTGDDSYIGKVMTVVNVTNGVRSTFDIEIIAL